VIVIALVLGTATARATPRDDLAAANKSFREGRFDEALPKYNALLRPRLQLADSNDLVEAYVNLGVCRIESGDDEGARPSSKRHWRSIRTSSSTHW
jgi:hypothetical protein